MPAVELQVRRVKTQSDMDDALAVRRTVFIDEQGVSEAEEIDEHDVERGWLQTVQLVGYVAGQPVATGRLLTNEQPEAVAHIGRVAVLQEHRQHGYGRLMMIALHEEARGRGIRMITLAAQLHAIPFYERLGYVARGNVFLDTRIEHRWMDLRL